MIAHPWPSSSGLPPPFPDVIQGKIPGVLIPPHNGGEGEEPPAFKFAVQNFDEFPNVGLEVHETKDATTVIYNPKAIDADKIDQLANENKLHEVFPDLGHFIPAGR
jgi:hypothetical protein